MKERTAVKPVRIQLSRRKGFKLVSPNGLPNVIVDRRTKWGNPCRSGTKENAVADYRRWIERDLTVASFKIAFGEPPSVEEIRRELAGKNICCWCKLTDACHGDVILEIASKV